MKQQLNEGTDIQCVKCKRWISKGEPAIVAYNDDIYHPECYKNELNEIVVLYMETLKKSPNEDASNELFDLAWEYNNISSEDIRNEDEYKNFKR